MWRDMPQVIDALVLMKQKRTARGRRIRSLGLLLLCAFVPGCFWVADSPRSFDDVPTTQHVQVEADELLHIVAPGETLTGLSRLYGADVDAIVRRNGISGSRLLAGSLIVIPAASSVPGGQVAAKELVAPVPGPGPSRLAWPIRGRVIRRYGTSTTVGTSRGLDIAAPAGTTVLAPADGRVRFVSGVVPGMGNVIVLDHGGGVWTFYGRLGGIAVAAGETVRAGQAIGTAGRTGRATQEGLHFRVYRSGKPVDPLPLLR